MPTVNGLEFERTANGLVPVSKVTMRGSHVVEPRPRSHRFPHCPPTTADGYPGVDPALDEKRYTAIMEEHQGNRNIVIKHLLEMNEKELENMDASKRKVEPSPTLSRAKSVRRRLSRIFRK
ncbi:MAG: hypothetical protein KVP17_001871 [Porospora cf. gigantea B]|uniref:uncharacterized protein n=1 Tax=Porospora cf. gigantea B TaxID=2853592 RepID=UPI003571BDD8|nr:MAG: hypothetical protein KVP17_001871 [Porospora cf. gigantea B]